MLRAAKIRVKFHLSKMFANVNSNTEVTGYNNGEVVVKRGLERARRKKSFKSRGINFGPEDLRYRSLIF